MTLFLIGSKVESFTKILPHLRHSIGFPNWSKHAMVNTRDASRILYRYQQGCFMLEINLCPVVSDFGKQKGKTAPTPTISHCWGASRSLITTLATMDKIWTRWTKHFKT